jgi:hypothetical protein
VHNEEVSWKLLRGAMSALHFDDSNALVLRLTIPLSACSRLGKFEVLPARYTGVGNTWIFETREIAKEPSPRRGGGNHRRMHMHVMTRKYKMVLYIFTLLGLSLLDAFFQLRKVVC